jgi:hypothetical protein
MRQLRSITLVGLLLSAAACGTAAPPRAPTAEERAKAFAWFLTLGFPDVKDRPLVRVATGDSHQSGDNPPVNHYVHGFLLSEKGDDFEVFTPGLDTWKLSKSPAGTPEHQRVGYEKVDLATLVTAYIKALRQVERPPEPEFGRFFSRRLSNRTTAFVLAWACWRNGRDDLADQLCDQAAGMKREWGNVEELPPPLLPAAADEIAHNQMWELVETFGNPQVTWEELLERYRRFVRNYPESKHQKTAKETAALLQQMVKEDAEHARRRQTAKPFDKLSKAEQIAELIFQLRDQNGHQFMQPGSCDIFDRFGGAKDTAAHRLVKVGYSAVPQLIEALEDERFTRSVGFHRNFYFSHFVLRVGDCAQIILEEITAQRFYVPKTTSAAMFKDGEAKAVKARAQQWYDEFQRKGEKQQLIDAVARGDNQSSAQAQRLVEKYPEAALPALQAGMKAATSNWVRADLVRLSRDLNDDGALALLLREAKEGPSRASRLAAAEALHKRGRPEGVAAMIAEWNGRRSTPPGVRDAGPAWAERFDGNDSGLAAVAVSLAQVGTVEAIETLRKDLRERPLAVRYAVLGAFEDNFMGQRFESRSRPRPEAEAAQERAATERLFIDLLDDTEDRVDMGIGSGRNSIHYPRVADLAAMALCRLLPARYAFDYSAPLTDRNRDLLKVKNIWRRTQGLQPLPEPARRKFAGISDETLQRLLDQLLHSQGAERAKVQKQIEQLGLGVLPVVRRRFDQMGKDDPSRTALDSLLRRLACTVADFTLAAKSLPLDDPVNARLKAMKGKPFDSAAFVQVARGLLKQLPKEAYGLRFTVERAGDDTGITLSFDLLSAARAAMLGRSGRGQSVPDRKGKEPSWETIEMVKAGLHPAYTLGHGIANTGGAARAVVFRDFDFADFEKALFAACASTADQPIEAIFQVYAEWRELNAP